VACVSDEGLSIGVVGAVCGSAVDVSRPEVEPEAPTIGRGPECAQPVTIAQAANTAPPTHCRTCEGIPAKTIRMLILPSPSLLRPPAPQSQEPPGRTGGRIAITAREPKQCRPNRQNFSRRRPRNPSNCPQRKENAMDPQIAQITQIGREGEKQKKLSPLHSNL
jgi:hypothetical protein